MRRTYPILVLLLALAPLASLAQPTLLPSIGLNALPADSEALCTLPFQTPPITSTGYFAGDTAADFRLFDLAGNAFHLQSTLASGKPVLMIAGSWTCPVYRNKLGHIAQMHALYGEQVEFIVVYTVEAHPIIDISPYFGAVNPGQTNLNAGITFRQPTTYGERKELVQIMLDSMTVTPPVYIDGPCNAWWNHYGPAPNNAYLIGTDGIIAAKHGWYNRFPDDIECDIRAHLGLPNTCEEGNYTGSFTLQETSNDTVYGTAGTTLTASARLTNSTDNDVQVRVVKLDVDMPAAWNSSLCMDVCYLPDVDTALIVIPAGTTQDFYYYFYSSVEPGAGYTRIGFRNENNTNNTFARNYWGISSGGVGIDELGGVARDLSAYPNPSEGTVRIRTKMPYDRVQVLDAQGRIVAEQARTNDGLLRLPGQGLLLLRFAHAGQWYRGSLRVVVE
ncbi:MAG: hypothetical protein WEC15_06710 [Flavobacteriales bacterium]